MSVVGLVTDGPVLLAAPVAAAAGLMSFLSPCVLPLVPGYLSFVTGLSGEELQDRERRLSSPAPAVASTAPVLVGAGSVVPSEGPAVPDGSVTRGAGSTDLAPAAEQGSGALRLRLRRVRLGGRVAAGTGLFVLGFTLVFVSWGAAFGRLGAKLTAHQVGVNQILGALTIVMGLAFAGVFSRMSWANREWRFHRLPRPGLLGAPMLGVMFGVGWAPCIGPTLTAVLGLAATSAGAGRGAFLSAVYCLGLGLPFLAVGLAFRRAAGALLLLRRHTRVLTVSGGVLLVAVGMLQLTGAWADLIIYLRPYAPGFSETPL
ncbi:cytochrome c biogenesis CcdA family protein [Frankia sp. R82]|uniref:cytochrome c biogenesis CcdA family protein n=1 Tax=Frankia sp. R82 TaxID=2950553 RepID=UPI002043C7C3|nr:cytochrome c biogenesis protein CcdA [Frankia sp. R82]MCM3883737.1 cytochrome c biogenesis protein CcdA [Frankia sp. R82]